MKMSIEEVLESEHPLCGCGDAKQAIDAAFRDYQHFLTSGDCQVWRAAVLQAGIVILAREWMKDSMDRNPLLTNDMARREFGKAMDAVAVMLVRHLPDMVIDERIRDMG